MRLTAQEVAAIKAAAAQAFGADVRVRLFGSRVDDARRGGDIDLLVEAAPDRATLSGEAAFFRALFERMDERRVDLVLVRRGEPMPAFAACVAPGSVPLG